MNTRNGYCQMKKTVPRPNADCAKGVSPFPTWNKSLEKSCTGEKAPKYGASCDKMNCYPQGLFKKP